MFKLHTGTNRRSAHALPGARGYQAPRMMIPFGDVKGSKYTNS
jgi:hypothetical protein